MVPTAPSALSCSCPRCGAALAVTLASLQGVRCRACGYVGAPPPDLAARLAAAQQALFATDVRARQFGAAARDAIARAVRARTRAVIGFGAGALPSVLFALLGFVVAATDDAPLSERATEVAFFSAPLFLYVLLATGAWYIVSAARKRLFDACAAVPPDHPGEPATCHICGAPIAAKADDPVIRCTHCGTDNVVHPAAFVRAEARRAFDLAGLEGALAQRSQLVEAEGRRASRAMVGAVVLTPILGWAGAFVFLVMGVVIDSITQPPPSRAARYVLVATARGTCVAKVVRKGDRTLADFGTNHDLPADLAVAATVPRFAAGTLVGQRMRIDSGREGVVRTVYGSRLTDQDSVVLDPTGDGLANGACLVADAQASPANPGR